MSVIQKPVAPCSICKINMVELGPMGDNGKKKCAQCKRNMMRKYLSDYYENYKSKKILKQLICVKCGKKYDNRNKTETCEICEMLILDLYNQSKAQECIYCGRSSGTRKFCSHNCLVKTTKLYHKRNKKIDEVLLDS